MNIVYFFTRTGDCEKIAKSVVEQIGGEVRQITDNKNWKGIFGFIKGGYYASTKKKTTAIYNKPQECDSIYLVFPVWAGAFPPAVRWFIDDVGRERITIVPKSMGSPLDDKTGFLKVIEIIGKELDVTIK